MMSQENKERYENTYNLPNEILNVFKFHVYYQTRKILKQMGCLLPTDSGFSHLSNNIDTTKLNQICDEFGVDFSSLSHKFRNSDKDEQKILHIVSLVKDYCLRRSNSKNSFWNAYNMGYDTNKVIDDRFNWEISDDMGWTHFIPKIGKDLTRADIARINESIRTYIYCVLGSQVLTCSPVTGQSGLAFEVQKEFLTLVEDSINNPKRITDSISRYQDVVSKSRTRLNFAIAPGLYLISDNLVMNMPNIPGYNNNTLLIAGEGLSMGVNDNINTKVIAHTLSQDLSKPTLNKRIPIDTHTKPNATSRGKAESKMESKDTNATKVTHLYPTAANRTNSNVTNPTNETVDKHGYQSSDNSNRQQAVAAPDDMKTLLIVSGVLGGLGYMYFYRH